MGKLLEMLPNCELIRTLAKKSEQHRNTSFDFLARLNDLRTRVSAEVAQINKLFPEYTPHDEQYHLSRLFSIADRVLGSEALDGMLAPELFLLAVGLYAHDWGMAVNDGEKQYITTGELAPNTNADDLCILHHEQDHFTTFAKESGLTPDEKGRFHDIPLHLWREYVRNTHALRSGRRVGRFFEEINLGVAQAAENICIGHWLEIEDLDNQEIYPPNSPVLGDGVNLRALTIYVRLIDLLDFSEDRTPYVIWKFVAPRDEKSQMEWKKHRAMQEIAVASYHSGRIIRAVGSTDDHEVYAALEDLKAYCEQQFRGCIDVLARMNDPRHTLDIHHIDWVVRPIGFNPVSIRFEFDRDRMFEILSDEIYQGDPYVFLRELVQNSIDAIRLRRALHEQHGNGSGNIGVIRVRVEHGNNGDAKVTVTDDGSGMDEYIIRNYLAVAGKSYYHSTDFERTGLKIDPISKFGIGILSCFMVADRLEIETCRDPYFGTPSEPLRIEIPAVRRQFRIEKRPRNTLAFGTKITVHVKGSKLPHLDGENEPRPLDVTQYLSNVAGFVEFPIVVDEGNKKTLILHPKQDPAPARKRFGEQYTIHQLNLGYPWEATFLPQDLATAKRFLREDRCELASDLGLPGYEGSLCMVTPITDIDLHGLGCEAHAVEAWNASFQSNNRSLGWFRWNSDVYSDTRCRHSAISRSGLANSHLAVYRDGILVAGVSPPRLMRSWQSTSGKPPARLVVNIPRADAPRIDLARAEIPAKDNIWDSSIRTALQQHLRVGALEEAFASPPTERLRQLARLVAYKVPAEWLWEVAPRSLWPVPVVNPGGKLDVLEYGAIADRALYVAPYPLSVSLDTMFHPACSNPWYKSVLAHWNGEPCVINILKQIDSAFVRAVDAVVGVVTTYSHLPTKIRFLKPPTPNAAPLAQEVREPMVSPSTNRPLATVIEQAIKNPQLLVGRNVELLMPMSFPPKLADFADPFSDTFGYGLIYINSRHPAARDLIRALAAINLAKHRKHVGPEQLGRLEDAVRVLDPSRDSRVSAWRNNLVKFLSLVADNLNVMLESDPKTLSSLAFVPGTVTADDEPKLVYHPYKIKYDTFDQSYGEILTMR